MNQSGALRLMLLLGNASLTPEEYQECFLQAEPPCPIAFNLVSVQPCLFWKPVFPPGGKHSNRPLLLFLLNCFVPK